MGSKGVRYRGLLSISAFARKGVYRVCHKHRFALAYLPKIGDSEAKKVLFTSCLPKLPFDSNRKPRLCRHINWQAILISTELLRLFQIRLDDLVKSIKTIGFGD